MHRGEMVNTNRPLGPGDFETLQPRLNAIEGYLGAAKEAPEEAADDHIAAILLMEEVVEEVRRIQGKSLHDSLKARVDSLAPAERAAVLGGLGAGALSVLSVTGLGGFGIAAGGTAFGVAGIAGAAVATGGVGLAGAAGLYVLYKGGTAAAKSDVGQQAVNQVRQAGKKAADQINRLRKPPTTN